MNSHVRPDLKKTHRQLCRDKKVRKVLDLAGGDAWLVGGIVRDLISSTGRVKRGGKDLDFVVSCSPSHFVSMLRSELGGTIVTLREESITRLVLPGGDTLDVSIVEGDIVNDLKGRDFTINAIAWSPTDGFIDPGGGIDDICARTIRHMARANLEADPLRLLRAYRLMASAGFRIHAGTSKVIKELAHLSARPARERLTDEIIKTVMAVDNDRALRAAIKGHVLQEVAGLSTARLSANLRMMARLRARVGWVSRKWREASVGQGMSNYDALMLSALLMGSDMSNLALCRSFMARHSNTHKNLAQFQRLKSSEGRRVYDLIVADSNAFINLALMTGKQWAIGEQRRYQAIVRRPIVSASELMEMLSLKPGPDVGRILREVEALRFVRGGIKRNDIKWIADKFHV